MPYIPVYFAVVVFPLYAMYIFCNTTVILLVSLDRKLQSSSAFVLLKMLAINDLTAITCGFVNICFTYVNLPPPPPEYEYHHHQFTSQNTTTTQDNAALYDTLHEICNYYMPFQMIFYNSSGLGHLLLAINRATAVYDIELYNRIFTPKFTWRLFAVCIWLPVTCFMILTTLNGINADYKYLIDYHMCFVGQRCALWIVLGMGLCMYLGGALTIVTYMAIFVRIVTRKSTVTRKRLRRHATGSGMMLTCVVFYSLFAIPVPLSTRTGDWTMATTGMLPLWSMLIKSLTFGVTFVSSYCFVNEVNR